MADLEGHSGDPEPPSPFVLKLNASTSTKTAQISDLKLNMWSVNILNLFRVSISHKLPEKTNKLLFDSYFFFCFSRTHLLFNILDPPLKCLQSLITQRVFYAHEPSLDMALTLWLPGRGACQDPDILVYEFYFSSFEAGIANAISSFKWRKIHKCSIYLTKICVILWLRSLTNDDGNFRHVW